MATEDRLETELRDSVKRARGSAAMLFFADRAHTMPDAVSEKIGLTYTTLARQDTWSARFGSTVLRGRRVGPGESYAGKNYGIHGDAGTWLS